MRWVWATTPEGQKAMVNLDAVPSMARTEGKDAVTILFLGGVCLLGNGAMVYAQTRVKETPEELLGLPVVVGMPKGAAQAPAKRRSRQSDPKNKRKPTAKKRARVA